MNIKNVYEHTEYQTRRSLCLNEIRTNPQDADWRCAATPKGCAPGMAHIKNLAANLERSPLSHSYGYGLAGDRPILFARFPLSSVPFMQFAG
jgi:hypothetical protein